MPIYEWKCTQCSHIEDVLVRKHIEKSKYWTFMCEKCGGLLERKQFSRVNHMFTGFLRDDFYDEWEKNTPGDYAKERGEKKTVGVGI